jgi:hypothetical protein
MYVLFLFIKQPTLTLCLDCGLNAVLKARDLRHHLSSTSCRQMLGKLLLTTKIDFSAVHQA